MITLAPETEAKVPDYCPLCDEELAPVDDVNGELDIHDPHVNKNQVYRRHRRLHKWDDKTVPDPEDDMLLEAYYSVPDDNDDATDDVDDDENSPLDSYTVEMNYSATLRISVEARSEAEAKRKAKDKKFEENLSPEVTDLVHTRVSDW